MNAPSIRSRRRSVRDDAAVARHRAPRAPLFQAALHHTDLQVVEFVVLGVFALTAYAIAVVAIVRLLASVFAL